jgi:hypothetical protein
MAYWTRQKQKLLLRPLLEQHKNNVIVFITIKWKQNEKMLKKETQRNEFIR